MRNGRQEALRAEGAPDFTGLRALFVGTSLRRAARESRTDLLMGVSAAMMERVGVSVDRLPMRDHHVRPGAHPAMTEHGRDRDGGPAHWERVRAAGILVVGTPPRLGEESSVCRAPIERLCDVSGPLDDRGQSVHHGRVAGRVVAGDEDGIEHAAMTLCCAPSHPGHAIPPKADCGRIGEAGPGPLPRRRRRARRPDRRGQRRHPAQHHHHDLEPHAHGDAPEGRPARPRQRPPRLGRRLPRGVRQPRASRMRLRTTRALGLGGFLAVSVSAGSAEVPAEYQSVAVQIEAQLQACLGRSATYEDDFSCADRMRSECSRLGPAGDTTFGIVACNQVLLSAWDDELNRLWPSIRTLHETRGADELVAAQRSWIAFRDAECRSASAKWSGGSMAAYTGGICSVRMTAERVADFRAMMREH